MSEVSDMGGISDVGEAEGNDRDAHVVGDICGYITEVPPRSFFLFAGAGSGKTRTLVEVLKRLTGVVPHEAGARFAQRMRSRGQSVRVITYTKNAATVVTGRLGENVLATVSTIHSFCWDLIEGFDEDIREALLARNAEQLAAAKAKASEKVRGETAKDLEEYAAIEAQAEEIRAATGRFIYHPDRNTFGAGALQHAEVLYVAAWLLRNRPTMQRILEDRHPVVLIDESQDTTRGVLDALFELVKLHPGRLTLGLLGDHRQRIYPDGHRDLPDLIPENWARPTLKMNHRSQKRIVELINRIWEAEIEGRTQAKTGVRQSSRSEKAGGSVRIFVGNTKRSTEEKFRIEAQCAQAMANVTASGAWSAGTRSYKVLALEHKLAAKRGNFFDVFSAMELLDKDAATPQGNRENKGPSMVQMLLGPMQELAGCVATDGSLDEFCATAVLQQHGRLASVSVQPSARAAALEEFHRGAFAFAAAYANPDSTVRDVLSPVVAGKLFEMDPRLQHAFADAEPPPSPPASRSEESKEDRQRRGWHTLFGARWAELERYKAYLEGGADLATHQVVKGSEFRDVMVVMDDADAGGFLFSYDKLFGAVLSKTDRKNVDANIETSIDRTLRLLYVACSRAEDNLALVLWAEDPQLALRTAKSSGWFAEDEVVAL